VRIDLLLDSSDAHDPATCFLIRGEKPLWRELVKFDTAGGSATFGAATFAKGEKGEDTVLVASTECSGRSCEALPLGNRLVPLDLTLSHLFWRIHAIVPLEIVTEETASAGVGPEQVRQRLLERLKAFVGSLDLAPVQRYCASPPAGSWQTGGR
jgi:hypothetical protein